MTPAPDRAGASGDVLREPAPALSAARLVAALDEGWGVVGASMSDLPSERDRNVLVTASDGVRSVLKVSNPAEDPAVVDMEVAAMAHVATADPDLPVPRTVLTAAGRPTTSLSDDLGRHCLVRLVTVLPGRPVEGEVVTESVAEQVGAVAARTSLALQGFFHPVAGARAIDWDPRRLPAAAAAARSADRVPDVDPRVWALADRVSPALAASRVRPSWPQHADVTLTNVLAEDGQVSGIIDFGDMHHTAAVCDLAITLTSVLRNTGPTQPVPLWRLAGAVLRGYQRHRLLDPAEVDLLGDLVLARLALTALISATRAAQHPENRAYIAQYDKATDRTLSELLALTPGELTGRLHRLAGTGRAPRPARTARPPDRPPPVDQSPDGTSAGPVDLLARRRAVLGGSLAPLFYRRPLHVVRGEGPWLFTADGRRLLDAYNNVAVVGHAHPTVTQAVTRQLAVLNTHSRYLHRSVVELAERIVATMPDGLDTCLFTTSGTEANELAWRMATEATGHDGAVIVQHAYHGSTRWMADLSSNEWPPGHRPSAVATFVAPAGPPQRLTAVEGEARVVAAGEQLDGRGHRPALVLADSGFTSEGVLDPPPAFMAGLVSGAHEAGALYLADEVQAGYGRPGPDLWRFRSFGITPDFVTLGKPMGAGYPVGALVTRRELADVLARRYEYFSTFAATAPAAAAGNAVLDVLADEGLPERAVAVGQLLRTRLGALRGRHPTLGEVRGFGLTAGVDLLGSPDPDGAPFPRRVLDGLAEAGVLAGLTGPAGDVLKVRPPLVWTDEHVDLFCRTLDAVLGAVA